MPNPEVQGGVAIRWKLAKKARSFTSKRTQQPMTLVELRDPSALGNAIVLFLDGPAGSLADAAPGTDVSLRLDGVRGGRTPGELVGDVSRDAVEAAFRKAPTGP